MGWLVVGGWAFLCALALVPVIAKRTSRELPEAVCEEITRIPERRANQHVVDLELRNGRRINKVWIAWGRYPALFGGRTLTQRYSVSEVVHAHPHGEEMAA